MRTPAIAQLVVELPLDAVLRSPLNVAGPSFTLEFGGQPTSAPWIGQVAASRFEGEWRRGRDRGRVMVDLVPGTDRSTILHLTLEQPAGFLSPRLTSDDAHAAAVALRRRLEPTAEIVELPLPEPDVEPALAAAPHPA